jgi:hypothetical protein
MQESMGPIPLSSKFYRRVNGFEQEEYICTHADDFPPVHFEFWNFTYTMPANFTGTPSLMLNLLLLDS